MPPSTVRVFCVNVGSLFLKFRGAGSLLASSYPTGSKKRSLCFREIRRDCRHTTGAQGHRVFPCVSWTSRVRVRPRRAHGPCTDRRKATPVPAPVRERGPPGRPAPPFDWSSPRSSSERRSRYSHHQRGHPSVASRSWPGPCNTRSGDRVGASRRLTCRRGHGSFGLQAIQQTVLQRGRPRDGVVSGWVGSTPGVRADLV